MIEIAVLPSVWLDCIVRHHSGLCTATCGVEGDLVSVAAGQYAFCERRCRHAVFSLEFRNRTGCDLHSVIMLMDHGDKRQVAR